MAEAVHCPECDSSSIYKDGLRYTNEGQIQRYLCRVCGYRFSKPRVKVNVTGKVVETSSSGNNNHKVRVASGDAAYEKVYDGSPFAFGKNVGPHNLSIVEKGLNNLPLHNSKHQVCAQKDAKNLVAQPQSKIDCAGERNQKLTVKGQLLQFALHCRSEGLTEETVRIWHNRLKKISENAELNEPENVKKYLANTTFAQGTKYNMVVIYNAYLKFVGKTWKRPKYRLEEKLPEFIPTEQEIDALICGCGKKTATILQTIKETGMRIGEALRLKWTWLDIERNILTLNAPEKHGRPQACKVSSKLVGMLQALPKKNEIIFAGVKPKYAQNCFKHSRRRLANKLGNPRLAKIHFHLIRH